MTTTAPTTATTLADVQRARDALIDALAVTAMPEVAHLEVLASLSLECQQRSATAPNALDQLLFLLRQRQAEIERRISLARRTQFP